MPTAATKRRAKAPTDSPTSTAPGRPRRAAGRERRQIVVDTALLNDAMRLTGRGQSDTVNEALARMTENAAILEGLDSVFGAFPDFPYDSDRRG